MTYLNTILNTDVLDGLALLPDKSVNMCVTSPPYYGLRNYGHKGQIGLEKTPELYVSKMVNVFREVKRVLKDDGTLWLNVGDSYANNSVGSRQGSGGKSTLNYSNPDQALKKFRDEQKFIKYIPPWLKPKDLIGIPWMLAFALRADGWYLRQDIIWHKPNPMPESVNDRCTKSHEYIFLLSKSKKYYFDLESIMNDCITNDTSVRNRDSTKLNNVPGRTKMGGLKTNDYVFVNKRSVWTVATYPYSEAHFATFPERLIEDCIKAGCPENGIVLDPFMGAGTTALVARKLNRNYIGIELNKSYVEMANKRLHKVLGIFI